MATNIAITAKQAAGSLSEAQVEISSLWDARSKILDTVTSLESERGGEFTRIELAKSCAREFSSTAPLNVDRVVAKVVELKAKRQLLETRLEAARIIRECMEEYLAQKKNTNPEDLRIVLEAKQRELKEQVGRSDVQKDALARSMKEIESHLSSLGTKASRRAGSRRPTTAVKRRTKKGAPRRP